LKWSIFLINILKMLSEKYLPDLPIPENCLEQERYAIRLDMQTMQFTVEKNSENCDFLSKIFIGKHIEKVAKERGWKAKDIAAKLNCAQSTVSDLYAAKSLKTKKLILISDALGHNFIADVYLSWICIIPVHLFDGCMITLDPREVHVKNPNDHTFSMEYERRHAEKKHGYP